MGKLAPFSTCCLSCLLRHRISDSICSNEVPPLTCSLTCAKWCERRRTVCGLASVLVFRQAGTWTRVSGCPWLPEGTWTIPLAVFSIRLMIWPATRRSAGVGADLVFKMSPTVSFDGESATPSKLHLLSAWRLKLPVWTWCLQRPHLTGSWPKIPIVTELGDLTKSVVSGWFVYGQVRFPSCNCLIRHSTQANLEHESSSGLSKTSMHIEHNATSANGEMYSCGTGQFSKNEVGAISCMPLIEAVGVSPAALPLLALEGLWLPPPRRRALKCAHTWVWKLWSISVTSIIHGMDYTSQSISLCEVQLNM